MLNSFLFKSALIKLEIIDNILQGKLKKILIPELISEEFNVNQNTVKKVLRELGDLNYVDIKKKAGTKVKYNINSEKIENYNKIKIKIQNLLETSKNFGFSDIDIFACFISAFKEFHNHKKNQRIIFVEKDYYNLWVGKHELEQTLGIDIIPMLLDDALKLLKKQKVNDKLIITTYYCQPLLEMKNLKIFPLKITPPIEQLININLIPEDAKIVILTISDELRNRLKSTYKFLQQKFKNLKFITIQEVLEDKNYISEVDILLTLKNIYHDYKDLFQNIKKVVVYSRFHDDEGIELLKRKIKSKTGT